MLGEEGSQFCAEQRRISKELTANSVAVDVGRGATRNVLSRFYILCEYMTDERVLHGERLHRRNVGVLEDEGDGVAKGNERVGRLALASCDRRRRILGE